MAIRPEKLILRCYGYKLGDRPFVGVCLDLNIAVEAEGMPELKRKMNDAIISYVDAVLDTDDKPSIALLMNRKAPLRDWMIYYLLKFVLKIKSLPPNFTFKEYIPIHLAHRC